MQFSDTGLSPEVLGAVEATGYTEPTPIQAAAIPLILSKRDLVGIAQTGTGKTAAFTLPMISMLSQGRARARMPRSLILCPTRELAAQVAESFETYGQGGRLSMALLIGGVSFEAQNVRISRGADVLIATPGRLLDHVGRGRVLLNGVQIVVLDEADRMLDMGFIPDVEKIFRLLPFTRQTLLFSATMPPEIARLAKEFLQAPETIEVTKSASTVDSVRQWAIPAPRGTAADGRARQDALVAALREEGDSLTNAIVFCNRKRTLDAVVRTLRRAGFDATALHGDLDQRLRMSTLTAFRNNEIRVLVASDVAARGLDIPIVSHIFNYDVPHTPEDYVHRIGRTARAGRSGSAITLFDPSESGNLARIETLVRKKLRPEQTPSDDEEPPTPRGPKQRSARSRTPAPARTTDPSEAERPQQPRHRRDGRKPAPAAETREAPRTERPRHSATNERPESEPEIVADPPEAERSQQPRHRRGGRKPAPTAETREAPRTERPRRPATRERPEGGPEIAADPPAFLLRKSQGGNPTADNPD